MAAEHWRYDGRPHDGTAWEEIDSGETLDAAETDYVTGHWPGFIVEGIEPSQSLHDVGITATFTKGHSVQDTVRFTVVQPDPSRFRARLCRRLHAACGGAHELSHVD
jgi:hypothetical protein